MLKFLIEIFKLVAADVIKFLANNDYYKQIFVHGLSNAQRYGNITKNIGSNLWTSVGFSCWVIEIPSEISTVVATNVQIQKNYVIYHLKTFHEAATQHYIRSSQMFHTNLCHAPALFFVSKTDPLGPVISNQLIAGSLLESSMNHNTYGIILNTSKITRKLCFYTCKKQK